VDGQSSLAGWLRWKYRLCHQTAKEKARVAKGLAVWPAATAAFAAGEIPYSSLRQIVRLRVYDPDTEAHLIRLAVHGRSEDVTRVVRRALDLAAPDHDDTNDDGEEGGEGRVADLFEVRKFWAAKTIDGIVTGGFVLGPVEGRLLLAALDTYLDGRHPTRPGTGGRSCTLSGTERDGDDAERAEAGAAATPTAGADGRTLDQKRADALMEMVAAYLAGGEPDTSGADRHTVNIVTDAETAATGRLRADSCCETLDGVPLPVATLARLLCDATLVRVLTKAGRITDIGTKHRSIPPALRKKLLLRDRGCVFPGCPHQRWVDVHHIQLVDDHGPTDADKLVQR
jgi:hypothetical protein